MLTVQHRSFYIQTHFVKIKWTVYIKKTWKNISYDIESYQLSYMFVRFIQMFFS